MKISCTQLHCECVRCIRIIFIYSLRSEAKHNHQFLEAQYIQTRVKRYHRYQSIIYGFCLRCARALLITMII